MAARVNKIRHDEETRAKIKTSQLINRLQSYVFGEVELENGQVTAALGLIKKTIPDLTSTESKVEVLHRYVARVPEKATSTQQWQQQHEQPTQH